MEGYVKAVWNDVLDNIKDSIEDPESRQALKNIIDKALIKNKGKLPSSDGGASETKNVGSTMVLDKGKTVSAYNLHWNEWKEENTLKEYPDPDDETVKMSAHKYWQKHIWPNLSPSKKKVFEDRAIVLRKKNADVKAKSGATAATKGPRKASKSAFQLFLEKMKTMFEKTQEFTDPDTGDTLTVHKYLVYVWNTKIKEDADLKEPFEKMAKEFRESENDDYDLSELPHLDPEKLLAGDLDDLELIED